MADNEDHGEYTIQSSKAIYSVIIFMILINVFIGFCLLIAVFINKRLFQ